MSSSSTDSGTSPPPTLDDEHELVKPVPELVKRAKPGHPTRKPSIESTPLIIAAYRHGDQYHKRRVKVPSHISWREFLALLSNRLNVRSNCDIGIYDENGIEIVSVEDLVPNDVLVVKERQAMETHHTRYYPPEGPRSRQPDDGRGQSASLRRPEEMHHQQMPVATVARTRLQSLLPPPGAPLLTHFIKANHYGYYFLAEIESARVGGRDGGREGGREGRAEEGSLKKRTHCVVKVPSCDKSSETSRIFEMESTLLRKVSGHRSIVATPTVQILNFANEFLQLFFSHLPEHKQPPLTELFFSGTCSEAYIYPLYGVTMATKIKSGLSPEKAVRYAYQLADTMYFLQQRGVIHQTLLPENIQVMSNDRVMVCNFETAVQTDPSTCTLLISHSFVAPSNRMGLAPEVLNGFNRVDPEMIDYSTQYPWSFGALSVVMATGQHPLRNYPGRYLMEGKVKYRSHNYQSLPDASKYPSLFCRLVKRSLSCDPLRRPSLFQITSIMKKDSRTLTMMSSSSRGKSSVVSSPGVGSKCTHHRDSTRDHMETDRNGDQGAAAVYTHHRHASRQHSTQATVTFPSPGYLDHDQTTPSKRTKTEAQGAVVNEYRHFPPQGRQWDTPQVSSSHDSHVPSLYQDQVSHGTHLRSHDSTHTPHGTHLRSHDSTHTQHMQQPHPPRQFGRSYDSSRTSPQHPVNEQGRQTWSDVGRSHTKDSPHYHQTSPDRGALNSRPSPLSGPIAQQRRGSVGGFSDDFNPLGGPFPSPSASRVGGGVTQSQSSVRYLEEAQALRDQRMSRKRSSATTESDGNGTETLDTEYQRLLPEDSADELLTNQTETETAIHEGISREDVVQLRTDQNSRSSCHDNLPQLSGAQDLRLLPRRPQLPIRSYEASRRSLRRPSDFRRTSSLQQGSMEQDGSSLVSSLVSRRCHSDSETRVDSRDNVGGHAGRSLHSSPLPPEQSHAGSTHVHLQTIPTWNTFPKSATRTKQSSPLNVSPAQPTGGDSGCSDDIIEVLQGGGDVGSEPMHTSPATTHVLEASDKLSDLSTSAQVGAIAAQVVSVVSGDLNMTHQEQAVQSPAIPTNASDDSTKRECDSGHPQGAELLMEYEINGRVSGDEERSAVFVQTADNVHSQPQQHGSVQSNAQEPQQAPVVSSNLQQSATTQHPGDPRWREEPQQTNHGETEPGLQQPSIPLNPAATTVYSGPHIMSPIAEASQECSTQHTATQTQTFSGSQTQHTQFTQSMHSLSPLPEQTNEPDPRRSTSPFHHNALGNAVPTPLSPDAISNNSISHRVAGINRSQTPQLEPPSVSSDTSHSLTRSSEVDSSHQATVHFPHQTEDGSGLNTFIGQDAVISADSRPVRDHQFTPHSVPQNAADIAERLSQITPTPEMTSVPFAVAPGGQQRPEAGEHRTPSMREEPRPRSAGSGALHFSGTYESSVSEEIRDRHGGQVSIPWSTTSAPPDGYGSLSRYNRRARRSASPVGSGYTQSVLSDSVAVHFRAAGRTNNSIQNETMSQRSLSRRRHRGSTGSSGGGTGMRQHYTMHRISQDLEMMTRAIEGMDSGQPLESGRTGRADLTREERLSTGSAYVPAQSHVQAGSNRWARSRDAQQNHDTEGRVPFGQISNTRSSSVEPSPSRRHNVSGAGADSQRYQPHSNARNFYFHPNLPNSLTGLSQIPPNDDSPEPLSQASQELANPPNLAQSGGTPPVQVSALSRVQFPSAIPIVEDQRLSQNVPTTSPPQAQMDSYDYLPPYSPPRPVNSSVTNQASQRNTATTHDEQPAYNDPPPSYEEIFGQQNGGRQRQRQRRPSRQTRNRQDDDTARRSESQSQTEHSSHRTGRTSGHRKLPSLTSLFKRNRRHTHEPHSSHSGRRGNRTQERPNATATSSSTSNTQTNPSSDRRSRSRGPSTLQRTASWVALYNQTPRPAHAYQQLERDFRTRDEMSSVGTAGTTVHSAVHSQVSHSVSDAAAMAMYRTDPSSHSQPAHTLRPTPGLPLYRHPPPFLHNPSRDTRSQIQTGPPAAPQHSNTCTERQTGYNDRLTDHGQTNIPQDPRQTNSSGQADSLQGTITSHSQRQVSHTAASPALLSSPYSPSLLRSRGNPVNLSQPNIHTYSRGDSDVLNTTSSVPHVSTFRRVLANPPRTRPISSLVSTVEYGRVGTSMTSVVSPLTFDPSEPRSVSVSMTEPTRSDEQRPGSSGRSGDGASNPIHIDQPMSQEVRSEQLSRQSYLPWQLDTQRDSGGEGETLRVNGNANNVNSSASSAPGESPNATPTSSPVLRRHVLSADGEQNVGTGSQNSQNQTTENGASQNGNGIVGGGTRRGSGGDASNSQRSTPRSRAVSRRLAQQLSSSDDDLTAPLSSSSSQGRTRHRRKRGDGSSRSSSRQGNQSQTSPFTSPVNPSAPVFFPSFQSQTTDLPHDGLFSTVSSDMTLQSTAPQEVAVSHDSHVMSQHQSQDQQVIVLSQVPHNTNTSQQEESRDQPTTQAEISHDRAITSPSTSAMSGVTSPEISHDQPTALHGGSHDHTGDVTAVHLSELHSNSAEEQESATPGTSVTHSAADMLATPPPPSKPCGHVCVAGEEDTCCVCRQSVDSITELFQGCEICESRRSLSQECSCAPNKLCNLCPIHGQGGRGQSSVPAPPIGAPHSSHHHHRKHVKNCLVM